MEIIAALNKARILSGSDAKTAAILGMPKQHLSNVRNGLRRLTPYQSARLAELVGEPWHAGALARLEELAASEEERQFWQGKSRTLMQTVARVAVVGFLILGGVLHVPSGNAGVFHRSTDQTIYCASVRNPTNGSRRTRIDHRKKPLWTMLRAWCRRWPAHRPATGTQSWPFAHLWTARPVVRGSASSWPESSRHQLARRTRTRRPVPCRSNTR